MPNLDEKQAFAVRLKQALKRSPKKIGTAADLALQFNLRHRNEPITPQAAQKWLAGKSRPTVDKIETLADWLRVSVQWLRYGIGEKAQPQPSRLLAKEPVTDGGVLSADEVALMLRIRSLTDHRRYLVVEIVEQFALEQEMWRR